MRGRFVVLDGLDGCGKSTQAERLVRALAEERPAPPLHLREPGSTELGERLRELFLAPELPLAPAAEALLVTAARAQMLAERVGPALAEGRDVVCERFHPSTFAYQGVAGGLGGERVLALCEEWAGEPAPDVVVLLALDAEAARARRAERGRGPAGAAGGDRIEARGEEFHREVARGYRTYGRARPGVAVVDGSGSVEEVHHRVLEEVRRARA